LQCAHGNVPPVLLRQRDANVTVSIAMRPELHVFGKAKIEPARWMGGRRWFFSSTLEEPPNAAYKFLGAGNTNVFDFELELPCETLTHASTLSPVPCPDGSSLVTFEWEVTDVYRK
jgi:hypothetical protein